MSATPEALVEVRLDRMTQAAATLSADGTIIKANGRLARMLGYPSIDLPGTNLGELAETGERDSLLALTESAQTTTCQSEMRLRRANRAFIPVLITLAPLAERRTICLITDLAEHQRRTEADERQRKFLGMLAHEFRNMLAPIKSAAEVLRRRPLAAPEVELATDVIERQVDRMLNLVDDLKRINPRD